MYMSCTVTTCVFLNIHVSANLHLSEHFTVSRHTNVMFNQYSNIFMQVLALHIRVQCSLTTVSLVKMRLALVRMRMHCTVWLMMSPAVEHHPVLIVVEHYQSVVLLVMVAVAMDRETGISRMVICYHLELILFDHSVGMPDGWLGQCL